MPALGSGIVIVGSLYVNQWEVITSVHEGRFDSRDVYTTILNMFVSGAF